MPVIKCNGKDYAGSDMDIKSKIVTFESGDGPEPDSAAEVPLMESGGLMKSLMRSASLVARNTRYLLKMLGNTDISTMADGTLTRALKGLSDKKMDKDAGISLTGDVLGNGTFNPATGGTGIQAMRKGCIISRGSLEESVPSWYKVAECAYEGNYHTPNLVLLVTYCYAGNARQCGILKLQVRMQATQMIDPVCIWTTATSGIGLGDFMLSYGPQSASAGRRKAQLWVRNAQKYQSVLFAVLAEGLPERRQNSLWTLYDHQGAAGEESPEQLGNSVRSGVAVTNNPIFATNPRSLHAYPSCAAFIEAFLEQNPNGGIFCGHGSMNSWPEKIASIGSPSLNWVRVVGEVQSDKIYSFTAYEDVIYRTYSITGNAKDATAFRSVNLMPDNMYFARNYYSGVKEAAIKTRFPDFNTAGGTRQTIFVFGNINFESVFGNIVVDNAGNCSWSGVGIEPALAVDKDTGRVKLIFPRTMYDDLVFMSGREVSIAEPF